MRLHRNKFLAWLKARRLGEVVGEKGNAYDCPIARYYRDASGHEIVVTNGYHGIKIDRGDGGRLAPYWVARFVRSVDDESREDKRVEAWRAIQLLESV